MTDRWTDVDESGGFRWLLPLDQLPVACAWMVGNLSDGNILVTLMSDGETVEAISDNPRSAMLLALGRLK